jgi:hypothetical protein
VWSGWPSKTRSKIRLQPVDFCLFLLKRSYFNFFKKKFDPSDLVKTWWPRPWTGGLKTMLMHESLLGICYNIYEKPKLNSIIKKYFKVNKSTILYFVKKKVNYNIAAILNN